MVAFPPSIIDLNTLQVVVSIFCADVDYILEMRGASLESVPIDLVEDTMINAFLIPYAEPQPQPCGHFKRHYSSRTTEAGDDARARKKKRTNLVAAMKAFFVDEEDLQIRARKMAIGASSSISLTVEMSTTDCVEIFVGTTEADPSTDVVGSTKPDPSTC